MDDADDQSVTGFGQIALSVWNHKPFIAAFSAIGMVAIALLSLFATPEYTVKMEISPPADGGISNILSQFGSLAGAASSLTGIRIPSGDNPNFTSVVQILRSPAVLTEIDRRYGILKQFYPKRWDEAHKVWTPPSDSPIATAIGSIKGAFHIPAHPYPTADDLALLLKRNLETTQIEFTDIYEVSLRYKDPDLAAQFLTWDVNTADAIIRAKTLKRIRSEIDYIDQRLQTVTIAEHRQALSALLSNLERQNIVLSGGETYAVVVLEPPTITVKPTLTGVAIMILGGLVGGAVLAIAAILLLPSFAARANDAVKRPFARLARAKPVAA